MIFEKNLHKGGFCLERLKWQKVYIYTLLQILGELLQENDRPIVESKSADSFDVEQQHEKVSVIYIIIHVI